MQRGPQDWDAGPSVVDSLLRHKWLVALAVLIGVVAAYGWSARQPERYEATVQLFLSPVGGQGTEVNGDQDPDRVLRNQVELLNSAAVLDQVGPDLGHDQRRPTGVLGIEAHVAGECADAAPRGGDLADITDGKLLHLLPTRDGHASAYAGL